MHKFFTRALERRGIYTGTYQWAQSSPPRPRAYLVLNERSGDMIRIEGGFGGRSFFIDWGRRDDDD